jgi:CRP-like cAMP-binding protein
MPSYDDHGEIGNHRSDETAVMNPIGFSRNRLLVGLPQQELDQIHASAEQVRPRLRQVLFEPGDLAEHVYFPQGSVYSLQTQMSDRCIAEALTVGHEGMLGLSAALDLSSSPSRVVCLLAGPAVRVPAALIAAIPRDGVLFSRILRYAAARLTCLSQLVACNGLHTAQQRYARWVLTMHDRAATEEFPITQELLSQLLGLTRPTVSLVAQEFQAKQLIHYAQGRLTVDDRAGLERIACECYRVLRAASDEPLD